MGYIVTDNNRYLGEHSCGQHHYGDQTIVRECCVEDARQWQATTMRVAITTEHPAYKIYCAAWNSLTEAERRLVGDIKPVYDHGPAGFEPRGWTQAEMAI